MKRILILTLPAIFLAPVFVSGCRTADGVVHTLEIDDAPLRLTYRSQQVPLQIERMSEVMWERRSIGMRAIASCHGDACVPDEIRFVFVNQGQPLPPDHRSVRLEAGPDWREYSDPLSGVLATDRVESGHFLEMTVDTSFFRAFAEAPTATAVLGSSRYHLSRPVRETFRQMLADMAEGSTR